MISIPEIAKRLHSSVEDVINRAIRSGGPPCLLEYFYRTCIRLSVISGPSLNNTTTPADVRFHDDLATYTGISQLFSLHSTSSLSLPSSCPHVIFLLPIALLMSYQGVHSGGHNPSFSPSTPTIALENLLDRSPADSRGVKTTGGADHSNRAPKR